MSPILVVVPTSLIHDGGHVQSWPAMPGSGSRGGMVRRIDDSVGSGRGAGPGQVGHSTSCHRSDRP
ncbi:hypothetical protein FRP1_11685 [Pseudonocardia sp. EC080625-04]|nr:hypothetical protein FRP1_11685 [Pseudonocardia sp. EC080625-04]